MKWIVEVIAYKGGEVVKTFKSSTERAADKIDRGLNINLNHDQFYTRVTSIKEKKT
jgi:hypothetical protein